MNKQVQRYTCHAILLASHIVLIYQNILASSHPVLFAFTIGISYIVRYKTMHAVPHLWSESYNLHNEHNNTIHSRSWKVLWVCCGVSPIVRMLLTTRNSWFVPFCTNACLGSFLQPLSKTQKMVVSASIMTSCTMFVMWHLTNFECTHFTVLTQIIWPQLLVVLYMYLITLDSKSVHKVLQRQASELEQQYHCKTDFLNTISHEFRTPLNAIIGSYELLLPSVAEKDKELLQVIGSSANVLLENTNSILSFARLEKQNMIAHNDTFDLRHLVNEVCSMIRVLCDKKKQEFVLNWNLCSESYKIEGDSFLLRETLTNLLSNAIKFTNDCGTIRLSIEPAVCGQVRFVVQDTGIGMNKEFLPKLFQPFMQQDASIRRKFGGTGLGLAIAYTNTKLMGGSLSCESELGKGTTFTCIVPLHRLEEEALSEVPTIAAHPHVTTSTSPTCDNKQGNSPVASKTCLIVDDNELNIKVMSKMLDQLNVSHDTADSGTSALEKTKQMMYNWILLDANMPDMDGLHCSMHIKHHCATTQRATPRIVIVSGSPKELLPKSYWHYADDFFQKPIHLHQLRHVFANNT